MLVLGVDSSSAVASAALCRTEGTQLTEIIASGSVNDHKTHSQTLMPLVQSLFEKSGVKPEDIDAFAVTTGPGSFTGLRIGVSMVKGMAFALGKPCRGVSTLEAMAHGYPPETDAVICAAIDARCGNVYNGLFEVSGDRVVRLCEDRALPVTELTAELAENYSGRRIMLAGDGAELIKNELPGALIPENVPESGVQTVLAALMQQDISPAALMPKYLRLPQAERERLAREQARKESENNNDKEHKQ